MMRERWSKKFFNGLKIFGKYWWLGWKWFAFLLGLFLAGIIIYFIPFFSAEIKYRHSVGILFVGASLSHLFIDLILYILYPRPNVKENRWRIHAMAVGFCESFLYPFAFLTMRLEIIGFWIGLKTALGWKLWYTNKKLSDYEKNQHNRRLVRTLIGNFLSILSTFITFIIIAWILGLDLEKLLFWKRFH